MSRGRSLSVYRRISQIAFILVVFLVPVFNIFRYDTSSQELIVFGQVWGLGLKEGFYGDQSIAGASHVALHFFLRAILPWVFFLSLFPLLGLLTGRFFCGWLCPEGAMFEFVDFLSLRLFGRRNLYGKQSNDPLCGQGSRLLYGALASASAIVLPIVAGISLTGYLIAPKTIWGQLMGGHLSFGVKAGIIGVTLYMFVTSVLVRHVFCKYICAAGLMQMLFGWVSPVSLRLKMDMARLGECTDCKGCERACFMNVMPRRNKRDISCVNCGACVTACDRELGPGRGLFQLGFGGGGEAPREHCTPQHTESGRSLQTVQKVARMER